MRLGISSYTYTWAVGVPGSLPEKPLGICGLIEKAGSSGISLIQIADNLPLENLTQEELEELHEYALAKNISIETGGRGLTPENTMQYLKIAENLGSPFLRMVIDSPGFQPGVEDVISIIREIIPEFRSGKIRLAIENHDRFKAREFERLILASDPEWTGICLDSANSLGAGEGFETVSEILAPYTINLHIKDFTIKRLSHKMGFLTEGTPAGRGMLDIPGIIEKLSVFNRCQSAILELWTPPEESIGATIQKEDRWANESLAYLKSII